MTDPDFSQATKDALGRRARFQCSNPDCGIHTIGPNGDPHKATLIGEAAHIHGALPTAKRYDAAMSDATRASITNGIWLCRNCHGKIDRDAVKYPAPLLFAWRREHEDRVLRELGTRGDIIRHQVLTAQLEFLAKYPQIIQRIALDKPKGWEWRFAAELMRHLNRNQFKRLRDMRARYYYRAYPRVTDEGLLTWITGRTVVMQGLIAPLAPLFDRLTASFGPPGEPGNLEEIHDVCILINEMLVEIVQHEEVLRFTSLPENAERLRTILMDAIGKNAERLEELPQTLDEVFALIDTDHGGTNENPKIITWRVPFELPTNFVNDFEEALADCQRHLEL